MKRNILSLAILSLSFFFICVPAFSESDEDAEARAMLEALKNRPARSSGVLDDETRKKLLEQQNAAFEQQKIEKQREEESKKLKQYEGSKYLEKLHSKIKSSISTKDIDFLYKKYDSANSTYYKKLPEVKASFAAYKSWKVDNSPEAMVSLSKESIEFSYVNSDGKKVEEKIDFTVISKEYYQFSKTGKEKFDDKQIGFEYVIKTKELGIIHIWCSDFWQTSKQQTKVWFEAAGVLDFDDLIFMRG